MRDFVVPFHAGSRIIVVDEYNDCFQILLLDFRAIDPGFGEDNDLVAALKRSSRRRRSSRFNTGEPGARTAAVHFLFL
jgi:hypothetical protein